MEYIFALHEKGQEVLFRRLVLKYGHQIVTPETQDYREVIRMLEKKPDKVLMEANYGSPGSHDFSPIIEVSKAMQENGFDIKNRLLGVTSLDYLVEKFSNETGIPVISKLEIAKINEFLR